MEQSAGQDTKVCNFVYIIHFMMGNLSIFFFFFPSFALGKKLLYWLTTF